MSPVADPSLDVAPDVAAVAVSTPESDGSKFAVHLDEFDGPFDLLLSLIARHKLEVTELALSQVTDEFVKYIRDQGNEWDLEEATAFLVVAATLLDLKAAKLLPSGEVEDEEDLALLEARDLLFARLLQYRAFKEVSTIFADQMEAQALRLPREATLEPQFAALLPDVIFSLGLDGFAALAASALEPKVIPTVGIDHIHAPVISVADQVQIIATRLRREGQATFRSLVSDTSELNVIIARFLGLLELFRQGRIVLDQAAALGDLHVRWIAEEDATNGEIEIESEFDEVDLREPAGETPNEGTADTGGTQ